MIAEYAERIALRLSKKQLQQIEQLIRENKAKNRSELVRQALWEFLAKKVF